MSEEFSTVGSVLPHLSADDLDALVKTEMFGAAPLGLSEALEANIVLWKSSLSRIINSIETQVAERRAALSGKGPEEWREFDAWRKRSMPVLRKAQERHSYVKAKMVAPGPTQRPFNRMLIAAISDHRQAAEASGRTPSDFDLRLWETVAPGPVDPEAWGFS